MDRVGPIHERVVCVAGQSEGPGSSRRFSRFDPNRAQVRTRLFLRARLLQIQASFSRRRGAASASASPFPRRRPRPPPPGRRAVEIVRAWIDFSVLPLLVRKP